MQIVLVDDSKSIVVALDAAIRGLPGVRKIVAFTDPAEALEYCSYNAVDLLLADYTMPKYNGIELVRALKAHEHFMHVPVIMITSQTGRPVLIEAIEAGITEFINKPFDPVELKARVRNLLDLRRAQRDLAGQAIRLVGEVRKATRELAAREEEIIWRLARAIEFRDGHTGEHISRVAHISMLMAKDLGLDDEHCRMIYLAAPLHDVGKIGISDSVLLKPGRLTPDEIAEMRKHVGIGVQILENGSSDLLRIAEAIASGHHEKWDGTGYPEGVAGELIPLEARIVAIADVFEALCSERPYKKAWSHEEAHAHIIAQSGSHFDPACVAAFQRQWPVIEKLMRGQELVGIDVPGIETPDDDDSLTIQTSREFPNVL
ncbi:HD domain-containing phosphohydrolase [Agrobacterium tumefaciens]|uniref:HD domain-containing phosphohydrolase n=1 Tax=Agrobacterium tumefaciens TaxID=358 RepID=UPI00287C2EF4|nr:HD domain-containing phosphohydrolase [Agrobacterium tumefaciens]MDS7594482.1 response regulator [Agrobacterium tumefaciens]